MRRSSATDDVRGSFDATVDTVLAVFSADERLALNDEIDEAVVDVIGQHEHKPGKPAMIRTTTINM